MPVHSPAPSKVSFPNNAAMEHQHNVLIENTVPPPSESTGVKDKYEKLHPTQAEPQTSNIQIKSYTVYPGNTRSKHLYSGYGPSDSKDPSVFSDQCLVPVHENDVTITEAYLILLHHEPVKITADESTIETYMTSRQYMFESFREDNILTYYFTQLSKPAYQLRMCHVNENREKLKHARQWVARRRAESRNITTPVDHNSNTLISEHPKPTTVDTLRSEGLQKQSEPNLSKTTNPLLGPPQSFKPSGSVIKPSRSEATTLKTPGQERGNKSDFAQAIDIDLPLSENQTLTAKPDSAWLEEVDLLRTVVKSIQNNTTEGGKSQNHADKIQPLAGESACRTSHACCAGDECNQAEEVNFNWSEFFSLLDEFFKSRNEIVTEIQELHEQKLNTDLSGGVFAEDLFACITDIQQQWEDNNLQTSETELSKIRTVKVEKKLREEDEWRLRHKYFQEQRRLEREHSASHRENKGSEPLKQTRLSESLKEIRISESYKVRHSESYRETKLSESQKDAKVSDSKKRVEIQEDHSDKVEEEPKQVYEIYVVQECRGTCAKLFGVCTCYALSHRTLSRILQSLVCRLLNISSYSSSVLCRYLLKLQPVDVPVPPADFAALWNFLAAEPPRLKQQTPEHCAPSTSNTPSNKLEFKQTPLTCCQPSHCMTEGSYDGGMQTIITDCSRQQNTKCTVHSVSPTDQSVDKKSIWELSTEQLRGLVCTMNDARRLKLYNMLKLRKIMDSNNSPPKIEPTTKPSEISQRSYVSHVSHF